MGYFARLHAKYCGLKSCKNNPDYFFLKFISQEIFKGALVTPTIPNLNILISREELEKHKYQEGQAYMLECDTRVEAAKQDYPARVNFQILKATPTNNPT